MLYLSSGKWNTNISSDAHVRLLAVFRMQTLMSLLVYENTLVGCLWSSKPHRFVQMRLSWFQMRVTSSSFAEFKPCKKSVKLAFLKKRKTFHKLRWMSGPCCEEWNLVVKSFFVCCVTFTCNTLLLLCFLNNPLRPRATVSQIPQPLLLSTGANGFLMRSFCSLCCGCCDHVFSEPLKAFAKKKTTSPVAPLVAFRSQGDSDSPLFFPHNKTRLGSKLLVIAVFPPFSQA